MIAVKNQLLSQISQWDMMPKETFADVSKPNLAKLAWWHLQEMHFMLVKTHDHRTQTSFCGFKDYWASIMNQLRMHSFEVMHLISSSCDGKGTSATCRTNSQRNQQGPNRFQRFFAQHQKVNLFLVIKTKQRLDLYCLLTKSQCSDGKVGAGVLHVQKVLATNSWRAVQWMRLHRFSQLYFVTVNKLIGGHNRYTVFIYRDSTTLP